MPSQGFQGKYLIRDTAELATLLDSAESSLKIYQSIHVPMTKFEIHHDYGHFVPIVFDVNLKNLPILAALIFCLFITGLFLIVAIYFNHLKGGLSCHDHRSQWLYIK